jgi:rod shape-determining protein MreC
VRTPKKKIFALLFLIALFFVLFLNSRSISNHARASLTDTSAVFLKACRWVVSFPKRLIPFASLRDENKALREKINLLSRKLEEAQGLRDENKRLKGLINFRKEIPYTTIPAEIIGRDPTNWSGSVIIDKGLDNGVRENRAVISTKGLVGRTLEAGRHSAKILLITDPNSKVGVVIQRNRQGGILAGRPDGKCKMIYIALDSDVAPGDKVVTAGVGSIFPKGILVGEVLSVEKEPGRLYKNAIVRTTAELSKAEEVLCIR